jgi:hypothetical protein
LKSIGPKVKEDKHEYESSNEENVCRKDETWIIIQKNKKKLAPIKYML